MTVFEDDITTYTSADVLQKQLNLLFTSIPLDWDIIFLGRCGDICENMIKIKDNIYQTYRAGCTHAYIISLKCAKKLMERALYTASDFHIIGFTF